MSEAAAFIADLVQSTDVAIVGKDLDGVVLVWNAAAERLFGWSAAEMLGRRIHRIVPEGLEEDEILARIRRGEAVDPFFTRRLHRSGRLIEVFVTISPVRDRNGRVVGSSSLTRDAAPLLEQQGRLHESERRFRLLADNISQLAWIARPDGHITWYNKQWFDYTGTTPEQMLGWGWKAVHAPDQVDRVVALFQHAIANGVMFEDIFPLRRADGEYRWFLTRASPIRDDEGRITHWFGTNTDITEQREQAEQIRLLLLEVNHRSKNLLATIQALARRTAPDDSGFLARFEERVRSLAINQDILVSRQWREVPVAQLAAAQLAFVKGAPGEVCIAGGDCSLTPRGAEVLGMALHELATNSLKYGALSVPGGQVHLDWSCPPDVKGFVFTWRESGGPSVQPPTRKGFGTTLICDVPRHNLAAEVSLVFAPAGICWRMECDARVLAEAGPVPPIR